jgi:hypothetical protein
MLLPEMLVKIIKPCRFWPTGNNSFFLLVDLSLFYQYNTVRDKLISLTGN